MLKGFNPFLRQLFFLQRSHSRKLFFVNMTSDELVLVGRYWFAVCFTLKNSSGLIYPKFAPLLINYRCSGVAKQCSCLHLCCCNSIFLSFETACGRISARTTSFVSNQFSHVSTLWWQCLGFSVEHNSEQCIYFSISGAYWRIQEEVFLPARISVLRIFIYTWEKKTLSCLTAAIISTLSRQIINNPSQFMIKLIVFF